MSWWELFQKFNEHGGRLFDTLEYIKQWCGYTTDMAVRKDKLRELKWFGG